MKCNCQHHDTTIWTGNPPGRHMALVVAKAMIIAEISYLAYDNDKTGCFIIERVDSDALVVLSKGDIKTLQIMTTDTIGPQIEIGNIDIYDGFAHVDGVHIKKDICYTFCLVDQKTKDNDNTSIIKNPLTGRLSFL